MWEQYKNLSINCAFVGSMYKIKKKLEKLFCIVHNL